MKQYEKHIKAAIESFGNVMSYEDVIEGLELGQYKLWPGSDSVIITESVELPLAKVLNLALAGGNLEELELMLRNIEAWAKENGYKRISLIGRPGWSKSFLKNNGYKANWIIMAKELKWAE